MRKIAIPCFLIVALFFTAGACAFAAAANVSVVDFAFQPKTVTINVGDTVIWTLNGAAPHTVTSGPPDCTPDGMFNSGTLGSAPFSITFNTPGTFPYFCSFHCASVGMTGTVIVNAAQSTIPVPTTFQTFSYPAIVAPVLSSTPMQAQPVGIGSAATGGGILSIEVALNQFAGPVDVYFLLLIPAIDPINIYQLTSLNTFQTLSAGLSPWMPNVTGPISQGLFGDIPTIMLPHGPYYLAVFVTPAGDQSLTKGYLWITTFTL